MGLDVIAFPRRQGVFLATVVAVHARPEAAELLSVVSEDGASFTLPADRALVRTSGLRAPDEPGADPAASARALRHVVLEQAGPDWEAVHAAAEVGRAYSVAELADIAALDPPRGALRAALAIDAAAPWFRREGMRFVALAAEEVRAAHAARVREAWTEREERGLLRWWPERTTRGVPEAWRVVSLQSLGRGPDSLAEPEEEPGRWALRAVVAFAALGDHPVPGSEWGESLVRQLGLPPDPDGVFEELVAAGVLAEDVNPAPLRAGLGEPFGAEAAAEAERLAVAATTADDRVVDADLVLVAVDDAGTREVDDAISLRRKDGGWELGVHVADVAAGVPRGGALDAEIAARACSLYSADGSLLLMPERLVTERLSLTLDEPRAALSGFFVLDDEGQVLATRFERTLLRIERRLTYAQSRDPEQLAGGAGTGEAGAGDALVRLATALRARRRARGARILSLPGTRVELRDGRPELHLRRQDTPGDLVVSESMVLHNEQAAGMLVAAGAPALFRTQEPSDEPLPDPADPLFPVKVRRTFSATHMSARPRPHAGLGTTAYTQCTSPLRRYSDLVNQRQLAAVSLGETPPYGEETLVELAPLLADRERTVRRAGDARDAYWIARALAERDPPILEGVLARAPRRGRGQVWATDIHRQLPLRAPRDWRPPPVGTAGLWRIARVRPWRGRVEVEPAPSPPAENA